MRIHRHLTAEVQEMKVIKVCIGIWTSASRDKRELSAVQELGAEVEVLAKGEVSGQVDQVDGFHVTRLSSRPWKKAPTAVNRVVSLFTWANYLRKRQDGDILSCHDYIALLIGWMSNIGRKNKRKLIYDCHEFEIHRNTTRKPIVIWGIKKLEKFLMKRSAFTVVVNDYIADALVEMYHLKERPVVVRSTPSNWKLDPQRIAQTRAQFLEALHLPETGFIVMFHGHITPMPGIERLLDALPSLPKDVGIVIMGNGTKEYIAELRALAASYGAEDRVYFHPAVPVEDLWAYAGAADVETAIFDPSVFNSVISLPNKFLESIQSMTPLIIADFPVMGAILDQYGIGLKVDPKNPSQIAEAIIRMRTDRTFYNTCKQNMVPAKEELCWEKEKLIMQEAYRRIL